MKKILSACIILLICISSIPLQTKAKELTEETQQRTVQVIYTVPANVTFQNKDIIIQQNVQLGEKLFEPSHIDIEGYIFDGWYNGNYKWNFEKDSVTEHLTLVAKYTQTKDINVKVINPKENYMKSSIIGNIDIGEELEGISSGDNVEITLEVNDATNTVTEQEKRIVEKTLEKNKLVLGQYIDVSLFMEINDDPLTKKQIHNIKNKAKIEITIPENLRFQNKKYSIIRLHEGITDVIYENFVGNDWKLTFETDKFSVYAIAYSEADYKNPKTGDEITKYIIMSTISMFGIIGVSIYKRLHLKEDRHEI